MIPFETYACPPPKIPFNHNIPLKICSGEVFELGHFNCASRYMVKTAASAHELPLYLNRNCLALE